MQRAADKLCVRKRNLAVGIHNTRFCHLRFVQCADVLHQIVKVKRHMLRLHVAGFQLAHIQNIVDERQQMLGGNMDLFKAVVHALMIFTIFLDNLQHTHHTVNRRADIVAHAGKELRLRFIRQRCFVHLSPQALVLLLLLCMELRGVFQQHKAVDHRLFLTALRIVYA